MSAPRTNNPKSKQHLQEAYTNFCRYEKFLEEAENLDWAIVLLFYAAVHLVTAHAVDKNPNFPINNHKDREVYIKNNLSIILTPYGKLESASRSARYKLIRYDRDRTIKIHDDFFNKVRIELRMHGYEWDAPNISITDNIGDQNTSIQSIDP